MTTYEFNGEKYKKASAHQKEWGNSLIAELNLNGNESILDLGCGDGILTRELSELVPNGRVIGIDSSKGMIETAKKSTAENLSFVLMDINRLDFENEFDVIFSNAALHWVKDHGKLLKNCYSALKNGGMILWDFAGDGNCSNFFAVVRHLMQSDEYGAYFNGFEWPWYMPDITEYKELIGRSGFTCYHVEEVNRDRYFSNSDEMIRWIDQPSLVPFIAHIPEKLRAGFRNSVISSMLDRTKQPDGTCFETFRRIHIVAYK